MIKPHKIIPQLQIELKFYFRKINSFLVFNVELHAIYFNIMVSSISWKKNNK